VRLRNVTHHDVLVPQPHKNCGDEMYGSLFFRINIQRASGPVFTPGGIADYNFSGSLIQQRIKTWHRLGPGQSIDFREDIAEETGALLKGSQTAGKYSFSASYQPPYISAEDKKNLYAVRIDFPEDQLETRWLTYNRPAQ
jgi:hypothetical protein